MEWFLVYIALVVSSYSNLGLMTSGPFQNETACTEYAYSAWSKDKGYKEKDDWPKINWFNTLHSVHLMENAKAHMAVYFSCVKIRKPLIKKSQFLTYPQHHANKQKE